MANIFETIGALSNPFGVPSAGEWNLARGIYTSKLDPTKTMVFFYEKKDPTPTQHTAIDQINDTGGRRIVKYEYPYRDGQRLADLGRKGETFSMNIKFHGLQYQTKLKEFLNVMVNSSDPATVTHPIRGAVTARYVSHDMVHRYDEWNAVTIKVIFEEDNTDELEQINLTQASQDSALRTALQTLVDTQASISQLISDTSALLHLPTAVINAMKNRLQSLTGQISRLLGQLGVTYSSSSTLHSLAASSATLPGGVSSLSSGKTTSASLPAVYQVGFDPTTQASINSQIDDFVSANQITSQQAVYSANQARASITDAIAEITANMGNDGYDIVVQYRSLANTVQQAVESSLTATRVQVKIFTVQVPMSLRQVANLNGLTPDDQNLLESLNPYLPSVNYLPKGTQVTVPAVA